MAKTDIVDELGLVDPDCPVTRARRPQVDLSEGAIEKRKADARKPAGSRADEPRSDRMIPEDYNGRDPRPEWVSVAQEWKPRFDLLGQPPMVMHAVSGLIQAGKVGALVAAGGTGKTTLLLMLGVCIATGRPFFECDVLQGSFVLLSNDDPQEDLDAALTLVVGKLNLSPKEVDLVSAKFRVISLQGLGGTKAFTANVGGAVHETGLDDLILQALDGIDDLRGVALDTLRQYSGGNSNDEQVIKLTITGATEVTLKTGAFVILPHHTGKQNYRDGVADLYCGSGSAAIADNCRFVLLLQTTTWAEIEGKVQRTGQERGDPLVLTSTRGSLLMRPHEPIFLHRDGFYMGRIAGAVLTRDQQADEKDRAILRAVRGGAESKNAVYAVVGGKKRAALDRIDDLLARGHLSSSASQSGSPKLMLATTGATLLDA